MKRLLLAASVVSGAAFTAALALAQQPETQKTRTTPTNGEDRPSPPMSPREMYEHVRRGVVAVERAGAPVAVGTVLAGDGRILTSLSALAGANGTDVRYADGTVVHTKLDHGDAAFDLALLVPGPKRRLEGLNASEIDPSNTQVRAMLPTRGPHLGPALVGLKGPVDAYMRGGTALTNALDVDVQGVALAGAPLLDPMGNVAAVLVRACRGPSPAPRRPKAEATQPGRTADDASCHPIVVASPVSSVRAFLAAVAKPAAVDGGPAPWLGIRGESQASGNVRGVRVLAVAPNSPAQAAGLRPSSDTVVAVDGQPIDTPETLGESIGKQRLGETVKLLVFDGAKFREVSVVLRPGP